jgi:hypothetical protein
VIRVEDHLPRLYVAAEEVSARGQRRFRQMTMATLALLLVAAVGGLVEHAWAGWVSAVAFALSLGLTALRSYQNAEQGWYDGRAGAESAKSVTWKYAVGGAPFGIGVADAEALLEQTLRGLVAELGRLRSAVTAAAAASDVAPLSALRAEPLGVRVATYRDQRLEDQRGWYAGRAADHRATGRRWQLAMIAFEILGIAGAVLKGLDVVEVDLLSLFATGAAAAAAWLAATDVLSTARAYDFAALELESVLVAAAAVDDEPSWATFVADAEQTMSREHTMWLARRRAV